MLLQLALSTSMNLSGGTGTRTQASSCYEHAALTSLAIPPSCEIDPTWRTSQCQLDLVHLTGVEPARPLRALAPQASVSTIPPQVRGEAGQLQ